MLKICRLAEQLLASQEGLSSVELFPYSQYLKTGVGNLLVLLCRSNVAESLSVPT
jgi:hypothetical protein